MADKAAGQLWLRGILALGYTYGFRRGELLGNPKKRTEAMRCKQVDLLNNTVTLYSGETKSREGRTVVLTEEYKQLVTEMRKGKQLEDFPFTWGNGDPIRCVAISSNRAHDAEGQNRSCSTNWAAKVETFQPQEKCFFLTSPFIALATPAG